LQLSRSASTKNYDYKTSQPTYLWNSANLSIHEVMKLLLFQIVSDRMIVQAPAN